MVAAAAAAGAAATVALGVVAAVLFVAVVVAVVVAVGVAAAATAVGAPDILHLEILYYDMHIACFHYFASTYYMVATSICTSVCFQWVTKS